MTRMCAECPEWTRTVCKYAYDERWNEKSHGGEGCEYPLDDVAEAWKNAGWTPGEAGAVPPLPKAPRRRPTVAKTQLKVPTRPKVSAKIMRQADLFFGRAKK